MEEKQDNTFESFKETAKQQAEQEVKRINEIREKVGSELNVTEDEMRTMIKTFRNSPKKYAIRLERLREIKYILVGLMLAEVSYTKENMIKCGIDLYEILYLDYYGAISLRGDGTYWVYWRENKYRPNKTLANMEKELLYWTPKTLETMLNAVYSDWLSHIAFEEYKGESITVIEKFLKCMKKKWGNEIDEE